MWHSGCWCIPGLWNKIVEILLTKMRVKEMVRGGISFSEAIAQVGVAEQGTFFRNGEAPRSSVVRCCEGGILLCWFLPCCPYFRDILRYLLLQLKATSLKVQAGVTCKRRMTAKWHKVSEQCLGVAGLGAKQFARAFRTKTCFWNNDVSPSSATEQDWPATSVECLNCLSSMTSAEVCS